MVKPQLADLSSPYENLKRELKAGVPGLGGGDKGDDFDSEIIFQRHTARLPLMSTTPVSSPGRGTAGSCGMDDLGQQLEKDTERKVHDPLLHRVLDKSYRLMATPHRGTSSGVSPVKWRAHFQGGDGGGKAKETADVPIWQDSPMSSPEIAVPKLRSEAFMSPFRAAYRSKPAAANGGPRTPGVSVQTPAAGRKTKDVFRDGPKKERTLGKDEITWESDSDEETGDLYGGMSPPKTIQFALPPAKLLQTPGMPVI
jgi:DASH complex subunit ASK1